ncbi:hypothetical protein ACR79M_01360 [Sphingobacterium spiritivorum]|uniref:hypothetical protein n=1 Tax=Sphingobacterium TaxID=28453 RepID=UPI00191896F3|nr:MULTISPECIES: hypothetical protein [Sphingobacterium]QQT26094.1 hypothetical protein I6J02_20710 [Sphingobacterium spiritivorum]
MIVLIFATNIQRINKELKIKFNEILDLVSWTVDLEDVDKVLRIEAERDISREIADLLYKTGYRCRRLYY